MQTTSSPLAKLHACVRWLSVVACLLWLAPLVGCGGSVDPAEALARANETNLQRLTSLYWAYQVENDWKGPADEEAFKAFISGHGEKKLQRIGVDVNQIDGLFVNDRDGEPLKIRWGVPGNMMGSTEPVVFEATGVDGKRMVGFLNMQREEVEAARYEALWAGEATYDAEQGAEPSRR